MLDQVIEYGQLGWRVFPVKGKIPAIKGWKAVASADPEKLSELFQVPHTGIGLATGKESGDTVVDVDNKNGVNGFLTLEKFGIVLPPTVSVLTPTNNGCQYHYKYCPGLSNLVGALGKGSGIDIRNDGGLAILPPSNGGTYRWMDGRAPGEIEIAEFPQALFEAIQQIKLAQDKKSGFELPEKIVSGERNDNIFKYACKLHSSGMKQDEILSAVRVINEERCDEPLPTDEIDRIVQGACGYDTGGLYLDAKGRIKRIMENIVNIFNLDLNLIGLFYFNLFTNNIQYSRTPVWSDEIKKEKSLDDNDLTFIKYHLATNYKVEFHILAVQEAVFIVAQQNKKHPVRDYLNALKWDGTERLKNWLTLAAGVVDNLYSNSVGIKTLVAAIARIFHPGCKFDCMLILEGDQGLGKSTLVIIMAGDWFAAIPITDRDKDTVGLMQGAWIGEVEEMICFKAEDLEHVKAFLTRQVDKIRLPYRRNPEEIPRQCIFIGTINPPANKGYLRDQTGNRRFWPVQCKKSIDQKWLKENRDQLFAEAVVRFKAGEKLFIDDPQVEEMMKREQEIRQSKDPWTSLVFQYVNNINGPVNLIDILINGLGKTKSQIIKGDETKIGNIMKYLGWEGTFNKDLHCSVYSPPQQVARTEEPADGNTTTPGVW